MIAKEDIPPCQEEPAVIDDRTDDRKRERERRRRRGER